MCAHLSKEEGLGSNHDNRCSGVCIQRRQVKQRPAQLWDGNERFLYDNKNIFFLY